MSTIYIHYPFCISKCYYCDFNSFICNNKINTAELLHLYVNVLTAFLREFYNGENITSIYFGGGTPSLLSVEFVNEILNFIRNNFNITENAEISLEANPKTIDINKAMGYKSAGVNRLSIGVQSFIDADLRILGRIHNSYDALKCIYEMCSVFNNVSIDLIYNRPGQKIEAWKQELQKALLLPIQHISLYELIIEDNTYIKHLISKGFLEAPLISDEFFKTTIEITKHSDFKQYEVSNFAVSSSYYSRHNLSYWNYEDYFGVGAGAHSRVHNKTKNKCAIAQCSGIKEWLLWAKNPIFNVEPLSENDIYVEKLLMGLRTNFGIKRNNFEEIVLSAHKFDDKIWYLEKNNYILKQGNRIVLTYEGLLRLNMVLQYLTS